MRSLYRRPRAHGPAIALATFTLVTATAALAQEAEQGDRSIEEIVVTGTSLRGVAPVGSPITVVGREDIENTAAATTQDILKSVPNISNNQQVTQGSLVGSSYYAPTIHSLGSSASNSTLVLIDSHRIPLGNTSHPLPDPSIIPTIAIERIEVVADGSSAIYGSDAVAGVVNYITRDGYDGFMVTGQGGFADDYDTQDIGILWGTDWGNGSAMLAYGYSYKSNLPRTARDILDRDHRDEGGTNFMSRACEPATIQPAGSGIYRSAQDTAPMTGDPNVCQETVSDFLGEETRHNFMAKFRTDLTDDVTAKVDVLYAWRNNESRDDRGTIQGTAFGSGAQANPFYENPQGVTATSQTIRFQPDDLLSSLPPTIDENRGEVYYASGELGWDINDNYSLTVFGLAGRTSTVAIDQREICSSCAFLALNGTTNSSGNPTSPSVPGTNIAPTQIPLTTDNALDVWRPAGQNRTNPAVLAQLVDNYDSSKAFQSLQQARAVLDGRLFELPTGVVHAAVGAEIARYTTRPETIRNQGTGDPSSGSTVFFAEVKRDVKSVFAEVLVPLIGSDQGLPLVDAFDLSLSVRRDDYNTFGSTTNPKIGFDWQIAEGWKMRGSVSESFVAPPMSSSAELYTFSQHGTDGRRINLPLEFYPEARQLPGCENEVDYCVVGAGTPRDGIRRLSSDPGLEPQTGESWSIGFDIAPPSLPGRLSATFFNNKFRGGVTSPNPNMLVNTPSLRDRFIVFTTPATAAQLAPLIANTPQSNPLPADIYFFNNQDQANVVNLDIAGWDVQGEYRFDTGVGEIVVGGSFTYFTKFDQFFGEGGTVFSVLGTQGFNQTFSSVDLQSRGFVRWHGDNLSANLFVSHTPSHKNWGTNSVIPIGLDEAGNPDGSGGDPVDSFTTWDLHLSYSFADTGVLDGALANSEVYADFSNLLDEDPPFYNSADGFGPYNANPIGRVMSLGFRYRW